MTELSNASLPAATIPSEENTPTVQRETPRDSLPEPESGLQELSPSVSVKFNKQQYRLSLEDAATYAQKGMKYDTVLPLLDKLGDLARQQGHSLPELVDALCEQSPSGDVTERLATEFEMLRQECEELTSFSEVPRAAVELALAEGIPLLDAYLRYCHGEQRRIQAATQAAKQASEASAGTQRGDAGAMPDAAMEAMLRGVRGA